MRTDPRKACANAKERKLFAFLHDAIAHPLMALTNWSSVSLRFHDWTSFHAWPRVKAPGLRASVVVDTDHWGDLIATEVAPNLWSVDHPTVSHTLTVPAHDAIEAVEQAEQWFDELAEDFAAKQPNFARLQ